MREFSGVLNFLLLAMVAILIALPRMEAYLPDTGRFQQQPARFFGPFTLAVSWQPAFCETAPAKPECLSQTPDRYDASHFALHGLWPDPAGNTYCGVPQTLRNTDSRGGWRQLPEPEIGSALLRRLTRAMPGTASRLERHEWIKHGTCAGTQADRYFLTALNLLDALNTTDVLALFTDGIGTDLKAETIRTAFDQVFGQGAGRRVQIACDTDGGRRLIVELRISLSGQLSPNADLGELILAGAPRDRGCPAGIVDAVGDQ